MWYEKNYRRVFMDMHLDDSIGIESLSKLDPERFAQVMEEADVQSVVVKAKSHVGLHYWPGKLGRMHDGLKHRNMDYVGEMIDACHRRGIDVIGYVSQMYDNYAYEMNPSWRMVRKNGVTSREDDSRYGLVCPNNKDYQQYLIEILQELTSNYEFEGYFLDMPFWPDVCYCHACKERFHLETGHYIPKKYDMDDPVYADFLHRRQSWLNEFLLKMTKTVKDIKPKVSIEHNFAAIALNWVQGNTEEMVEASDYAGGDYYGGYLEQSFMCKYYNSITPNKPFAYITSRCDPNLFYHTVTRSEQDLMIHAMNSLFHGGAFSMCDAMNPDGTITESVYRDNISKINQISAKLEPYVSGDLQTDVAVWFNTNRKHTENFLQSPLNVAEVMRENNIPFNVIGSRNIINLKDQVLSVNDVEEISDGEMLDLESYVMNGGNLFITGCLGHQRLKDMLGVTDVTVHDYRYTYLRPTVEGEAIFRGFDDMSPYPVKCAAPEYSLKGDSEILAYITCPYTKDKDRDFSAIHSDPPGINTDWPGVVRKKIGAGTVLWVTIPLELTKATLCRSVLKRLVLSLLPAGRKFESNAPDFVEIVAWEKDGRNFFAVVNQQQKTPVYAISNLYIDLPGEISVRRIDEEEEALETELRGGRTRVILPELNVFMAYEVEQLDSYK